MDIQIAIGQAIRKIRISKGLSQEFFSDISSRTHMSVLENGKKMPFVSTVENIAKAMDVHPLTLYLLAYTYQNPKTKPAELIDQIKIELNQLIQK